MGADCLAENTPNTPEFISQFVFQSPKVLDFNGKKLYLVVRIPYHRLRPAV